MNIAGILRARWLRVSAIALAVLLILAGVLGYWVLPPFLKGKAEAELSTLLGRTVKVASVSIQPYAVTATVRGVSIADRDGKELAGFDELFLDVGLASLWRLAPVVEELRLVKPRFRLVRNADRSYNISDLIEKFGKQPPSDKPARFALHNLQLEGGRIEFDDRPENTVHTVADLRIGLPFLSSLPYFSKSFVEPRLSASVNGAPLELKAKAKPYDATLETELGLKLDGLPLAKFVEYLPYDPAWKLASGKLDADLGVRFSRTGDAPTVLLTGSLAVEDIALSDKAGQPLLSFPKLQVALGKVEPLAGRAQLESVLLQGLDLNLRRDKAGVLNLMALAPPASSEADKGAAREGAPFAFELASLQVSGARLRIADEVPATPFRAELQDLEFQATGLGNAPGKSAALSFSAATAAGESFRQSGSLQLSPLAYEGVLEADEVRLAQFMPYLAGVVNAELRDGRVSLALDLALAMKDGVPVLRVADLNANLAGLSVARGADAAPFLAVGTASVHLSEVDLAARRAVVESFTSSDGRLVANRGADGTLDLATLVAAGDAPAATASSGAKAAPWTMKLKAASVERWALALQDRAVAPVVSLEIAPLSVKLENLGTDAQSAATPGKVSVTAGVNGKGTLGAQGTLRLAPLATDLALDLAGIEVVPFQPYFTRFLNVSVIGGAASTKGRLQFEAPESVPPRVSYDGELNLGAFAVVEKGASQDLLRWRSLFFSGLKFSQPGARSQPLSLEIAEVALSEFFARIAISSEGRINLQDVLVREPAAAQPVVVAPPASPPAGGAIAAQAAAPAVAPDPAAPGPQVRIGQISLQGGRVAFSDQFVKPNYSANLTNLAGRVSGLSSDPASSAQVDIRGRVDNSAPLEIEGRLNPLARDLFLDLKARVRNLELNPFNTYAVKYVGYTIATGQLSLDLAYKVEKRKLEASNKVFVNQLTFGDKVDSPTATSLPVTLAVALLKNSRGEINIELPISGSLDDPQFSLGSIILQVIGNLIVKAVTAPFALLGAIFGGGAEELAYVAFEPGRAQLAEPARKRLESIATALTDRPAIRLEVAGRADADSDREGLLQFALQQKVRAQKIADQIARGVSASSASQVRVEPAEYPEYLKRAYDKETFPKPRTAIGLARTLKVDEMEKLMLTNTVVSEDNLRDLAQRRARAVERFLVESAKVDEGRVFLKVPEIAPSGAGGGDGKLPRNRADLSLRQ
jgi:uncharacterized protein involved in outer membrane biogenesis